VGNFFALILTISLSSHGIAQNNRVEEILKFSKNFQTEYQQTKNIQESLKNAGLDRLPKEDLNFLKKRISLQGLAPFEIDKTRMHIESRDFNNQETKININFEFFYNDFLDVSGYFLQFDSKASLEKNYKTYFLPAWKTFQGGQKNSFYQIPIFLFKSLFTIQGCTPADTDRGANSASLVLAYARLCADCVMTITNPTGALINTGVAVGSSVANSLSLRDFSQCRSDICKQLPIIGPLKDIKELHEQRRNCLNCDKDKKH
jgi:hypothetical protein